MDTFYGPLIVRINGVWRYKVVCAREPASFWRENVLSSFYYGLDVFVAGTSYQRLEMKLMIRLMI